MGVVSRLFDRVWARIQVAYDGGGPGDLRMTPAKRAVEDADTVNWLRSLKVDLDLPPEGVVEIDDQGVGSIINDHQPPEYLLLKVDGIEVRRVVLPVTPDGCTWIEVVEPDGWAVEPPLDFPIGVED